MFDEIKLMLKAAYEKYKVSENYEGEFKFLAMVDKARRELQRDMFPRKDSQLIDDIMLFQDD